jgi:UDP-xylose/UDP-N-acetylglucosamine transporter B4
MEVGSRLASRATPCSFEYLAGIFLTFVQFVYVTFSTLSTQFTFDKPPGELTKRSWIPRFKHRVVPLRRWIVQVILFLAVSLMNNWAFGLKVPVPIHIIFRSGGESN